MADLTTTFLGIKSPNPFWLASAPPTDKAYNVNRAFEAGWGGAVWKTLGEDPPIVNVNGPRYGAIHGNDRRVLGFNNIELITDRPLGVNLQEIRQIKRDWPDRALIVSVMLPMNEQSWAKYVPMIEDTGCDGLELNFGCPHGMSERGMGSAVGQVPEYIQQAAAWCKKFARVPVIVKLTPNITNILPAAKAAKDGGADAVSLINTLNSIMRVDYDSLTIYPSTDGMGSHGGYCGPAVKPIALHMVAEIARSRETKGLPISGIGGITDWRDAVDFLALGAGTVQVCTAAMVYGFKIIDDLVDGLEQLSRQQGLRVGRRDRRQSRAQRHRLAVPESQPRRQGVHRPGPVHQVRALPHRLRRHLAPGHHRDRERCAALRSDRRRVRGLQSLRQCLPGGGLHHHAADDERRRSAHQSTNHQRESRLDHAPQQPGAKARLTIVFYSWRAMGATPRRLDGAAGPPAAGRLPALSPPAPRSRSRTRRDEYATRSRPGARSP